MCNGSEQLGYLHVLELLITHRAMKHTTTLLIKLVKECEACHERLLKNTLGHQASHQRHYYLRSQRLTKVDATSHKHN